MTKYLKHSFLLIHLSILLSVCFGQVATYKKGKTEYLVGKTYKTTGQPLVKRSSVPKTTFLKTLGLKNIPLGYQIDHIVPLSQGGEDVPENMQLLTVGQHKVKTAIERGQVAEIKNTDIFFTNFEGSTQKPIGIRSKDEWQIQKYTSVDYIDKELNSKKIIYTGPKGGNYYYSVSGKKTYIKTNNILPTNDIDLLNQSDFPNRTTPSISSNLYNQSSSGSSVPSNSKSNINSSSREVLTGPRGGQYYINSNGNKTYIKKN